MIKLIEDNVAPNSTIISDKATSYVNVRKNLSHIELKNDYNHFWINHSRRYVNPIDEFINTNGIEGIWRRLRCSISKQKLSIPTNAVEGYLAKFSL